jgi:dethiobiotin synthetase
MFFNNNKKKKVVFITGTDTGVGKTFIATQLVKGFQNLNYKVGYFKPIETGCDPICNDVFNVTQLTGQMFDEAIVYSFHEPAAPYSAEQKEKKKIDIQKIKNRFEKLKSKYEFLVVEGAGGLLVPITKQNGKIFTYLDLIKELNTPVIIVARASLGTINHSVLTLRCLQNENIQINGIILNKYPPKPNWVEKTNPDIIKEMGGISKVITIPITDKELSKEEIMKLQMLV